VSKAALDVTAVVAGLADADAEQGAAIFRICLVCHVAKKGAPSRVGPNLWGIVGRPKASYPGFAYSESLRAKGGTWTYEELAEFIHEPRRFVPGTRMAFRGIDENTRLAQLIAHLRALSDSPAPLPVGLPTEPAALRGHGSAPR
jgi:cytochrome c